MGKIAYNLFLLVCFGAYGQLKKHFSLFYGKLRTSRGIFRTLSNIYDETFCDNNERLKAVNYFLKKLHFRCLTGL